MNKNKSLILQVIVLITIGLSILSYKVFNLHWPLLADSKSPIWTLELQMDFMPDPNKPVQLTLFTPPEQHNFTKLTEHFVSTNYGINTEYKENNRLTHWTIRRANNKQTLYYQLVLTPNAKQRALSVPLQPPTIPKSLPFEGASKTAAEAVLNKVRAVSADSLTFSTELIKLLIRGDDENGKLLLNNNASPLNTIKVAQAILSGAHIATTTLNGSFLKDDMHTDLINQPLLGVWSNDSNSWLLIDPNNAQVISPENYLIWWYGNEPLVHIAGGDNLHTRITINHTLQNAISVLNKKAAKKEESLFWKFSLFNLPLKTQELYKILIMIPMGALVILLLRNLIGLRTFGTFMPVLVALAFRDTHLFTGLGLFILVIGLGLLVRFSLDKLRLLLIARIATILSIVVIIMMTISLISYQLNLGNGLSIALFPIVIMTMTIERMSLVWEEHNPFEAILAVSGSLFAATMAYLVMSNDAMTYLLFSFPELLLIVIASMLLLGRYRGYRLSEIIRFKDLIPDKISSNQ